jgi:formylglycine-generating enzyme required for sulfatase activity
MYSFGDDKSKLGEFAWFNANAEQVGEMSPLRIGQKKPNPWGLCDMHGNLWEFCRDWYVHKLLGGRDPEVSKVKAEASSRVVRGGGWSSGASGCRSANRSRRPPAYRNHFLGFRVALSSI